MSSSVTSVRCGALRLVPLLLEAVVLLPQLLLPVAAGWPPSRTPGARMAASFSAAICSILLVELAQLRRDGASGEARPRPRLVDHVDRLVRQVAVGDVALGEPHRRLERLVRVLHAVVRLVLVAQPVQDLDRLLHRRRLDHAPAGSGARARRPSRCTCGTRRAWWRRCTAARRGRGPASACWRRRSPPRRRRRRRSCAARR